MPLSLKINVITPVFHSLIIVQVSLSLCQQGSECLMQRTMLAAVHATAKRLHLGIWCEFLPPSIFFIGPKWW